LLGVVTFDIHDVTPVRPFLKWAGGKRQLLPALRPCYPAAFNRYIEPFLGSGAVFFDIVESGRLRGRPAVLADLNVDLIGCYRALRDETDAVIEALEALDGEHRKRGAECYYEVRERFNARKAGGASKAAMFVYLNRTGFNGLFRLNRSGAFNVPAGRYSNPRICDAEHLRAVARAFGAPGVSIECAPFEATLSGAGARDFVYCDPPYAPLSRTASFAQYTAAGFTARHQRELQQAVVAAARRGAVVLLSNSSAPEIEEAYAGEEARRAGLIVRRVPARRAINSLASRRGPVVELIVSNAAHVRGGLRMAKSPLRIARPGARTASGD